MTKREKKNGNENNTINTSFENDKNKNDDKKNNNKTKIKNRTNDFCDYCQRKMGKDEVIANHWVFTSHKLKECKFKKDFKECRTCHEAFSKEEYDIHLRNKCGLKHGYVKCPLCHNDIPDNNKGFYQHLVKDKCPASNKK